MFCRWTALTVVILGAATGGAQSLNVDFGSGSGVPGPEFSGAGAAGVWNGIPGTWGVTYPLVALDGSPTGATVRNIGGTELLTTDHPATTDNLEALLDEYLVTYTSLETCLFFNGLENGTYWVITYAWLPGLPATNSFVTVDQATAPGAHVGGVWPGLLEEGITHSVHMAEVADGVLGMHSGLGGGSPPIAALNGLQLVLVPETQPFMRGDADADGVLALGDALAALGFLFSAEEAPSCLNALDVNDDGALSLPDPLGLLTFLFSHGAPLPPPFLDCGDDPTPGLLACEAYSACP